MNRMRLTEAAGLFVLLASWTCAAALSDRFGAFQAARHDEGLRAEVVALARRAMQDAVVGGTVPLPPTPRHVLLRHSAGVFVTLVENGRVRGCMGSLTPVEPTCAGDIVRATLLACTEDPRYPPLRASEVAHTDPCVTIVGPRRRVQSPAQLDPLRLGLFVQQGGRGGVLLPGEARSAGWQLNACRAKAGIPAGAACEMYVFETVLFRRLP